jgi:SRSO17 transposase
LRFTRVFGPFSSTIVSSTLFFAGCWRTQPALPGLIIERAIASNVPFSWVAADSVYGVGDIEMALKHAAKAYVLGVNANHPFRSCGKSLTVAATAKDIAEAFPEDSWQRLSAGEGTKGARLHDWVYLELADLEASDFDAAFPGARTRGLLIRRNIANGDFAFFSTWCPIGTSIELLVTVEGHRWAIEDSFETAKNELGLDHNETRSRLGRFRKSGASRPASHAGKSSLHTSLHGRSGDKHIKPPPKRRISSQNRNCNAKRPCGVTG